MSTCASAGHIPAMRHEPWCLRSPMHWGHHLIDILVIGSCRADGVQGAEVAGLGSATLMCVCPCVSPPCCGTNLSCGQVWPFLLCPRSLCINTHLVAGVPSLAFFPCTLPSSPSLAFCSDSCSASLHTEPQFIIAWSVLGTEMSM